MTLTKQPAALRTSILSPAVTAAFGFVVYTLSMITGEVFGVNADSRLEPAHTHSFWESAAESAPELAIGLVGVGIAVLVGRHAWQGKPSRLARAALILAIIAALTVPVFWAGWTNVFGAVAVGLALENRRRVGSLGAGAATALILGSVAFVAAAVICVLG
jgi:hypothetical protein